MAGRRKERETERGGRDKKEGEKEGKEKQMEGSRKGSRKRRKQDSRKGTKRRRKGRQGKANERKQEHETREKEDEKKRTEEREAREKGALWQDSHLSRLEFHHSGASGGECLLVLLVTWVFLLSESNTPGFRSSLTQLKVLRRVIVYFGCLY